MLLPVSDKRAGAAATVYGFDDLMELYRRSMDSVDWSDLQATDMNLCEHQCWATAMHSSQIYTPGPAISFCTSFCERPQKLHLGSLFLSFTASSSCMARYFASS